MTSEEDKNLSFAEKAVLYQTELELELKLYFYLNMVNLSDKIIIKITIYFNLYKHGLKI